MTFTPSRAAVLVKSMSNPKTFHGTVGLTVEATITVDIEGLTEWAEIQRAFLDAIVDREQWELRADGPPLTVLRAGYPAIGPALDRVPMSDDGSDDDDQD